MTEVESTLAGVRILDLTDERGIYGAKLLADLGTDVVRPERGGLCLYQYSLPVLA